MATARFQEDRLLPHLSCENVCERNCSPFYVSLLLFLFFLLLLLFWLIASDKYLALSYTLISKNLCACVCSSARVQDSECLPDDPLS